MDRRSCLAYRQLKKPDPAQPGRVFFGPEASRGSRGKGRTSRIPFAQLFRISQMLPPASEVSRAFTAFRWPAWFCAR